MRRREEEREEEKINLTIGSATFRPRSDGLIKAGSIRPSETKKKRMAIGFRNEITEITRALLEKSLVSGRREGGREEERVESGGSIEHKEGDSSESEGEEEHWGHGMGVREGFPHHTCRCCDVAHSE